MSTESIRHCEALVSLAATYWLHSTVLIGGVWAWLKWKPATSHSLQGRL